MKKILCAILAAAMLMTLCACGGKSGAAANFKPVSAKIDGDRVSILSAESFVDNNGYAAVRFYYEFTNNDSVYASAGSKLSFRAEQNGLERSAAYLSPSNNVPEYGNDRRLILPGVTIRCVAEYSYKVSGGELRFTISGSKDDELTAVFDPQSLPGRPGEWAPESIGNPKTYRSYSAEYTGDSAEIAILDSSRQASNPRISSMDVIQIDVDYTNLEDDPTYFESDFSLLAFQDGVELDVGTPAVQADTYGNGYVDIDTGDTIRVTRCWQLRSESPVEVLVTEWRSDTVLCAETFPVG